MTTSTEPAWSGYEKEDLLKADIKELEMAANISDTFHGRNCCSALDRIEEVLMSCKPLPKIDGLETVLRKYGPGSIIPCEINQSNTLRFIINKENFDVLLKAASAYAERMEK